MVAYYFGTREALLAQVVVAIGERVAAGLEAGMRPLLAAQLDTATLLGRALDELWAVTTSEPEAVRAYFALISGQWSGEAQDALRQLKNDYRALAHRLLAAERGVGAPLRSGDADAVIRLALAQIRGLALEWLEDPGSPALDAMLAAAKRMLAAELV
jgi:AcrR family transcriptional regulator